MDMREILDLLDESEELLEINDSFDIELGEDLLIETGVVDLLEDGVVLEADEDTLKLLEEYGITFEEDWSKYDEPTINRIKKGITKPVDKTDYNVPTFMRKAAGEQPKTGFDKRRASLIKQGIIKADEGMTMGIPSGEGSKVMGEAEVEESSDSYESMSDSQLLKLCYQAGIEKYCVRDAEGGLANRDEVIDMLKKDGLDESGLQAYLGKKKYGEKGMKALQKAGREGASKEKMAKIRAQHDKLDEVEMNKDKLQFKVLSSNQAQKYFSNFPNIARANPIDRLKGVTFNELQIMGSPTWSYKKSGGGKPLDRSLTEVIYVLEFSDGTVLAIFNHLPHHQVYDEPDVRKAWHIVSPGGEHAPKKGMDINYYIDTALEGDEDNQVSPDTEFHNSSKKDVEEAKYHGKEVPLGKKLPGDVKKSKVYVRKPNGKIVKVNFGDKKMRIKKSNPKRRKSFRARHNCKNPGPRWKARYWSCRSW